MLPCKVTTVGASSGVILGEEALARLKVRKGDTLYLTEAPDGGYTGKRLGTSWVMLAISPAQPSAK